MKKIKWIIIMAIGYYGYNTYGDQIMSFSEKFTNTSDISQESDNKDLYIEECIEGDTVDTCTVKELTLADQFGI
jgi:hypothetical protein